MLIQLIKKISVGLFLITMLLQMGGLLVVCQVEQAHLQHRMALQLRHSTQFQKLRLSRKQYESAKANHHEITFNHTMYDIKSVKYSGDYVDLLVLKDHEEKKLVDLMKRQTDQHKSKYPSLVEKLLTLVFITTEPQFYFQYQPQQPKQLPSYLCQLCPQYRTIFSPPPRTV